MGVVPDSEQETPMFQKGYCLHSYVEHLFFNKV
jgi:hypothetical protein